MIKECIQHQLRVFTHTHKCTDTHTQIYIHIYMNTHSHTQKIRKLFKNWNIVIEQYYATIKPYNHSTKLMTLITNQTGKRLRLRHVLNVSSKG